MRNWFWCSTQRIKGKGLKKCTHHFGLWILIWNSGFWLKHFGLYYLVLFFLKKSSIIFTQHTFGQWLCELSWTWDLVIFTITFISLDQNEDNVEVWMKNHLLASWKKKEEVDMRCLLTIPYPWLQGHGGRVIGLMVGGPTNYVQILSLS